MCDITNCLSQTLYSIIISLLIFNLYYYFSPIFYEVTTSFDKNSTRTFFILVLLIAGCNNCKVITPEVYSLAEVYK